MKRLLVAAFLALACIGMMTGCASFVAFGSGGLLYEDARFPMRNINYWGPATSSVAKQGEAKYTSILGIIATGDASLQEAMQQGGITKIHHIDQQVTNILGVIATYKIIVYGE